MCIPLGEIFRTGKVRFVVDTIKEGFERQLQANAGGGADAELIEKMQRNQLEALVKRSGLDTRVRQRRERPRWKDLLSPWFLLGAARHYQPRIMAITTTPGAALAKQHTGQAPRIIQSGQGHEAPDPQRLTHARWHCAEASIKC